MITGRLCILKTFMNCTPLELLNKEITEKDIISFAEKWNYQSFLLDKALEQQSHYGSIIASGWQTLMITHTLILDSGKISKCSIGSPGLEKVNWFKPVRPNDTVQVL